MKVKSLTVAALAVLLTSTTAFADDAATQKQLAALQAQIKQLQEQLNLLQRKQEVTEEVTKGNAEKFGTVEYGSKGLVLSGADKAYQLKVGGFAQVDTRKYLSDKNGEADQFIVRSARPSFDFKLPHDVSGKLVLDFGNGAARITDAYVDWKAADYATLRTGKFKAPLGLERAQGETDTLFVERGLTANMFTFRDVGFGAYGDIIPQTLEYQLALTNGGGDNADQNNDTSGGKDFSGRVFVHPFKNTDTTWLQGLGIGIAGSVGQRDGSATNTELSTGLKTTAQNNFFTYNPAAGTVFGNGKSTRINPQAYYYNGPFSLLAEYVKEDYEVSKSTAPSARTTLTNDSWEAIVTYVLTGEDASYTSVKPRKEFDPAKGNWGAFEVAARIGQLNVDDDTFPTFANPVSSARSIEEKVLGLNWYLSQNTKIVLNGALNTFEGGAATGDRPDEKAVLARVQFKF